LSEIHLPPLVAGKLLERAVKASVLNRHLTLRATKRVVRLHERVEDWAQVHLLMVDRAIVDRLLENRVLGSVPTVHGVTMAGVLFVVTSR